MNSNMNLQTYQAAREGAVWRQMSHFGRFLCTGADAAAILHHLTTNNIKALAPGAGCDAALVSSKARVLDWLTVYRLEEGFLVLTSPNRRSLFKPHAQKFVLFRQDVRIDDITEATALYGLFGPRSRDVLQRIGVPDAGDLPLNAHYSFQINGVNCRVSRTDRLPLDGVLIGSDDSDGIGRLVAQSGQPLADDDTYNVLRVEGGVPVAGLELTEDINPWEAGLDTAISLSKGCYNGQEVIARLHTYKKVKQGLCGLKLDRAIPMNQLVEQRVKLQAGGRDAGFITSSVQSPRFGPIALGYVRGDYQATGQQLEVAQGDATQTATVRALPFAED